MRGLSLHKEGLYLTILIIILLLLSLVFFSNKALIYVLLFLLLFTAFTYRVPVRISPPILVYNQIVSPVDGLVQDIDIVSRPIELDGFVKDENLLKISISVNYLTNNMIYAPVEGLNYQSHVKSIGVVNYVCYFYNKIRNYFKVTKSPFIKTDNKIQGNDYIIIGLQTLDNQKVILVQSSIHMPYSCQSHISQNEAIVLGERIGMMRFGGNVEIYLPSDSYVFIYPGKTVIGSETVIGVLAVNKIHHILEAYREVLFKDKKQESTAHNSIRKSNIYNNQKNNIRYLHPTAFNKAKIHSQFHAQNDIIYNNKSYIADRIMNLIDRHRLKTNVYYNISSRHDVKKSKKSVKTQTKASIKNSHANEQQTPKSLIQPNVHSKKNITVQVSGTKKTKITPLSKKSKITKKTK